MGHCLCLHQYARSEHDHKGGRHVVAASGLFAAALGV